MSTLPGIPPIDEFERKSKIKKEIMNFSNGLFENLILGISFIIALNLLYIYIIVKNLNIFSVMTNIFLLYLISIIILSKIFKLDKPK